MKKNLLSIVAMAVLMVISAVGYAQTTYTKVTSESELNAGDKVLLVGIDDNGQAWAMSYQKTNNRKALEVSMDGDAVVATVATDPSSQTEPFEITIGGQTGAWTFFDALGNGYLYAPGGGNYLKTQADNDDKGEWTLSMDGDGFVPTSNGGVEQNIMRYNPNTQNNDPLFGCYKPSSSVNGLVYIFKNDGGTPTIHPEPSNYPTDFAAVTMGTEVVVTWNDATGTQLPSKYLVVASTGNIQVPSDGTPVEDGELAKNVNYGVQAVTFTGLESNTNYNFAIFPYTNSGTNIDYKTDGNYPTAQLTTANIQVLLDENFDDGLGVFTTESITGEQEWQQHSYNGITYAGMNGYVSGAAHENEDWLISPEISFGRENIALEFRTAMKYPDANHPLRVMVSCDYQSGAPVLDGNWEDITNLFAFSTGDYEWVESGQVNITPYLTNQLGFFHIAFVYNSTDEAAASWEIDYVKVLKGEALSVEDEQIAAFNLYPNPAHDMVSFNVKADAQVSVYDVTGRMINTMSVAAGQGQYQVAGLENGVYFMNIRYNDGKTEVARFVKF